MDGANRAAIDFHHCLFNVALFWLFQVNPRPPSSSYSADQSRLPESGFSSIYVISADKKQTLSEFVFFFCFFNVALTTEYLASFKDVLIFCADCQPCSGLCRAVVLAALAPMQS